AADARRQRAFGNDVRAAHRILDHLNTLRRRRRSLAAPRVARVARHAGHDPLQQPPDRANRDDGEDDVEDEAQHGYGAFGPPTAACADFNVSSARLAACPSGPFGSIAITCSHALVAPARSCLPNARTMPRLSSVLVCFGLILSDASNRASALSGWF